MLFQISQSIKVSKKTKKNIIKKQSLIKNYQELYSILKKILIIKI